MSVGDMPTIAASAYGSTRLDLINSDPFGHVSHAVGREKGRDFFVDAVRQVQQEKEQMSIGRRFVQVIVSDPDPNVPLENCILYKGEPKVTDLTDQELYFELDIRDMLSKHNEARVLLRDKSVKDRTEYLEPAKIRDLRMTVVKIADL